MRSRTLPCGLYACQPSKASTTLGFLVVVFDFFILGINDVFILAVALSTLFASTLRLTLLLRLFGVQFLGQRTGSFGQSIQFGLNVILVIALERFFQSVGSRFDFLFLFCSRLVARFFKRLARCVNHAIGLIAQLHHFFEFLIFVLVRFSVTYHLVDLFVGQTARRFDDDGLFFAGRFVFRRHAQDTVGVEVEGNFDLRYTARCRRNVGQVETTERLVLGRLFTLTLQHVNGHGRLVIFCGREDLRFLGRDRRVLLDDRRHDTTHRFDTQRQRGNVEQQDVFDIAAQNTTLDRSTQCYGFIRVDVFARIFTEEFADFLLYQRHARLTTDQNDIVDVGSGQFGISQCCFARVERTLNQITNQCFQFGASHFDVQVFRTGLVSRDVRQIDVGLLSAGQFDFGFFSGFFQTLHSQRVARQVDSAVSFELFNQVVDDRVVEVFTTEEGVTVGGQHFELGFAVNVSYFDDGYVEGTTTQVVYRDRFVTTGLVHTVSQSGSGRLVDDTFDVQTRDAASVFSCLALRIVEVGRYGDDRFGHFFTEVVFGRFLHFLQHFSTDLRGSHFLAFDFYPRVAVVCFDDVVRHHVDVFLYDVIAELTADQTFYRIQRVFRVGDRLTFGRLTDQDFAVVSVCNDRRGSTTALCVFDDARLVTVEYRDTGVGGPQVNTDDTSHEYYLSILLNEPT
ncbi:hypothetical protein ZBT109_0241 [Zymobacter palmae]|uniref:Uncharacterized protein n=1 Tax=Zymobacter palmae TaxID=33074 RepID=A0A348HBN7_9GAMM|nr:hypothetical protein ZBT109_0241 [Zymobacter palmae]